MSMYIIPLQGPRIRPTRFLLSLLLIVLLSPSITIGQSGRTVSGVVYDTTRTIVEGASVNVKGTSRGTTTNAQGRFAITAQNTDVLVVSYQSMQSAELTVGNRSDITVILQPGKSAMEEVVVIGYGTVKRPDLTGAVGQANVAAMEVAPVASFAEALGGRLAGVNVSGNDGQPGSNVNIVIRGPGSLTQSTSPLYVVDGFPVEDLDPTTLNPEDIETLNVLKDASSTAIYGSRAANGVIVIQTKRGKTGKPVLTLNSSYGFQIERKKMELMSPFEFVRYQQERFPTGVHTIEYLKDKLVDDYRSETGTDFQDHVFTNGGVHKHNLSLRGGNEQTRYSISGSYFDQEGIILNTGLSRYTGRITVDQTISSNITAGITANYSRVKEYGQIISSSPVSQVSSYTLFRTWGYRPISYPNVGTNLLELDADPSSITNADFRINPVTDLENQRQFENSGLLEANAYIDFRISEKLVFKTRGGIRSTNIRSDEFYNSKTTLGSPFNPNNPNGINGGVRFFNLEEWSNENTLNYTNTFNNNHTITALALFGLNGSKRRSDGFSSRLLPNEGLEMNGLDEGIAYDPVANSSENSRVSYGGRLDYNFRSKYIITGTFRADASSKFEEHWGYFPGAAVAWNMHSENFFKNALPFISNSKLRFSYGVVGNDRIGDFARYPVLRQSIDGYSFNNSTPTASIAIQSVGNSSLRWEKTTSMDLGYELGLFNNRVDIIVDIYKKSTEDLLLNAQLPPSSGFGSATQNIGRLTNRGLELSINTTNIRTSDFSWESSFNISFNQNKIEGLVDGQQSLLTNASYESQFNNPLYISEIGRPSGMMFGYVWEGNYQFEDFDNPAPGTYILKPSIATNGNARNIIQPGDIRYRDMNGDGIINTMDKTIIGRGQPIHIGGFMNNFRYKNFQLGVFFQWSYGNNIYNANRLAFEGNSNGYLNLNQFATYADRWTPDNPSNKYFRAGGQGPIGFHSSRTVEDGSFLRLKTLSLSYDISKRFIQRAKMTGLSFNIAAQNVFTWTNYSGLDPEVSVRNHTLSPGFDFSAYPQSRTIVFGIRATF